MFIPQSGVTIHNHNFSVVLSHRRPSKVIIAVPHDGPMRDDFSGIFQIRSSGVQVRDMHVWQIVSDVTRQCLKFDMTVDTIRFLMARSYVDVNRTMFSEPDLCPDTAGQTAFDDHGLETMYRYYHSELDRLLDASVREYGAENVLFLDMHGFSKQPEFVYNSGGGEYRPFDIILGTANRTTINHGDIDRQLFRFMEMKSYTVFLPTEKPIFPDGDPYSAGHFTRLYAKRYGINTIQVEIAACFRMGENSKDAGEKLAADISEFLSQYYA